MGVLCGCRTTLREQLFLVSVSFQPTILELRRRCVALWRLRLHGVHAGRMYTLQELQDIQSNCLQARLVVHGLTTPEERKLKACRAHSLCRRHERAYTAFVLHMLQALLPEAQPTTCRQSCHVHGTVQLQGTHISLLIRETLCRTLRSS